MTNAKITFSDKPDDYIPLKAPWDITEVVDNITSVPSIPNKDFIPQINDIYKLTLRCSTRDRKPSAIVLDNEKQKLEAQQARNKRSPNRAKSYLVCSV